MQYEALRSVTGEREVLVITHHKGREWGGNFSIRSVKPTWRDVWAILRGRYQPKIIIGLGITPQQLDRILKETWTGGDLDKELNAGSHFLERIT